jgi:hypothetical protein
MSDYIKTVQKALEEVSYSRHEVPQMIKHILQDGKWKKRRIKDDLLETKEFDYFPAFVEAPRPWGLQTEWAVVQDLCKGYPDVELEIAKAKNFSRGGDMKTDSMNHTIGQVKPKTSKEKLLMQLERERPDLLKKVVKGELSANKAFLEAGILTPRLQATAQPEAVASMIKKHFTAKEIANIIKLLMG